MSWKKIDKSLPRSGRPEIEIQGRLADDKKVRRIQHITCAVCAGVAVQPIPFADIFVLTPIQAVAGYKIAAARGVNVSKQKMGEIIKEIAGVIGLGLVAQQFAIGAYKLAIPFIGAFFTIPMVYGLTFTICSVMDYYFKQLAAGRPIDREQVKAIWKSAKKAGKAKGKKHRIETKELSGND